MEMDVCLGSYDIDKAASFLCQAILLTKKQYNLFGPNEDHVGISYPNIKQKGIFKCYDI
jgi:hypothetical protein